MPTSSCSLVGADRPRIVVHPPLLDVRRGDAAVALAERAGMRLEPWQAAGVRMDCARREDGSWAAFEAVEVLARQNGKSARRLARALAGFLLFEERVVLWSAHEVKTALRAWRDMRRMMQTLGTTVNDNLIDVLGIPVKTHGANGSEGFERLDTGAEIKIIARSKGSGRGFSADLLVIDEAFAYTDEHADALMPTLTARPNPQILYSSSPPLSGTSGAPMYALRRRAERALTTGDTDGLVYCDWGAPECLDDVMAMPDDERQAYLDDRARWAATNPALGHGRVTEESILRNRRGLSEAGFAREVLGCWPREAANGSAAIDLVLWSQRADPDSRPGEAITIGVDVHQHGRMTAIAAAGRRADGRLHVKVIDHRPGTGWVVDRLRELRGRFDPRAFLLDPSGHTGALVGDLTEAGIEIEYVAGRAMGQACGSLLNDLREDALRHCGQPQLDEAVRFATTKPSGATQVLTAKDNGDISPLQAVTVAAHGFRLYGSQEVVEPWAEWV